MLVLGLVGLGCFLAPARGAAASDWAAVTRAITADRGSYAKTSAYGDYPQIVMMREWVTYDLRANLADRRLGLGDDPSTSKVEKAVGTRRAPAVRFVYRADAALMWNPRGAEKCGSKWVEMPFETITAMTGIEGGYFAPEPRELVRSRISGPVELGQTTTSTTYEIRIPATMGVPATTEQKVGPKVYARLAGKTLAVTVEVPSGRHPITMTLDATDAYSTLAGGPLGTRIVTTYSVDQVARRLQWKPPATVATLACTTG